MHARKLAKIMKALSNEKRLSLFMEIASKQESSFENHACHISEVVSMLKISAPTISHHLKELVNAELISTEKDGKFLMARINRKTVGQLCEIFSGLSRRE